MTKPRTQGDPKVFTTDIVVKHNASTGDWAATLANPPAEFQPSYTAGSPENAVRGLREILIGSWHKIAVREIVSGEEAAD